MTKHRMSFRSSMVALALFVAAFGGVLAAPAAVSALTDNQAAVCQSIGGGADCQSTNPNSGADVNSVIKLVINLFSTLVGIVAVVMIIMAGLKYVTAAGDSTKLTSAKNTLLYALIGLVIVALSQSIVRFTLNKTVSSKCPTGQTLQANGTCAVPAKP